MIVVSDTSPILNLARIARLELLPLLYQQVLIPSAVYDELRVAHGGLPAPLEFESLDWLTVASPNDRQRRFWIRPVLYAEVLAQLGES